jgi:hypothetical protein
MFKKSEWFFPHSEFHLFYFTTKRLAAYNILAHKTDQISAPTWSCHTHWPRRSERPNSNQPKD